MSQAAEALIEATNEGIPVPAEPQSDERRRDPRYAFSATVEATERKSRVKVQGRTADMSNGGCYVDTISPFPADTIVKLRLTSENKSCETQAKVVYSLPGMGMGVSFIAGPQGQEATIAKWIGELSGELQPEFEESVAPKPGPAHEASTDESAYVLSELVLELMRQGILSGARGKEMLQRLHR